MNGIAIRILCVVISLAAVCACGIPTAQYLGAPETASVDWTISPPTVTFAHNVTYNSGENFLGYEIYYKFYAYSTNPSQSTFATDLAVISAAAPGTGTYTVENRGFQRIWQADDTDGIPPLIVVASDDSATDFEVQLVFPDKASPLSPDPAAATFLDTTIELARTPESGVAGESFESDDISTDPNDSDVPPGIPSTDLAIHMGVVILAYGTDNTGGTFQPLYSNPAMVEEPLELLLK
jgi:hypothetical protein